MFIIFQLWRFFTWFWHDTLPASTKHRRRNPRRFLATKNPAPATPKPSAMPPPQPKNRSHVPAKAGQGRPPPGQQGRRMASRDAGERAAFFARREAATVLRRVLRGDASKRAGGSIKSLVYSPSVRNKRATFALVCQTLKCKLQVLTRCHLGRSRARCSMECQCRGSLLHSHTDVQWIR